MRKFFVLLVCLLMFLPCNVFALSNNYNDGVAEFVNITPEPEKVNFYVFRGEGCPHCERLMNWVEIMSSLYADDVNFLSYEVWENEANKEVVLKVKEKYGANLDDGVPYSVVGEESFYGFSPDDPLRMENAIRRYLGMDELVEASYSPFNEEVTTENGNQEQQQTVQADANQQQQTTQNYQNNNSGNCDCNQGSASYTNYSLFGSLGGIMVAAGLMILELAGAYYLFVLAKKKLDEPYFVEQKEEKKSRKK